MIAVIDWTTISIAGAFIVGVITGGVAVSRVTRAVMDYLRGEQHKPPTVR